MVFGVESRMRRTTQRLLFTATVVSLLASLFPLGVESQHDQHLTYRYVFEVNQEGFTEATILILGEGDGLGFGWVLVPKYQDIDIYTHQGTLQEESSKLAIAPGGSEFVFYDNMTFTYQTRGGMFNMTLSYSFTHGAFVIEPRGFFYSPQIGFPSGVRTRAIVELPHGFEFGNEQVHLDGSLLDVDRSGDGTEVETAPAPFDRISIEFDVDEEGSFETVEEGIFTSNVASRYRGIAERFLDLYASAYPLYTDVFNMTMENVDLVLFVPSYEQFLEGLGGFVPFTGKNEVGSVHLNIFYTRTLAGTIEIIALHELTHHFTLTKGISTDRLWFHEGLAQYMGVKSAAQLGFESAAESAILFYAAAAERLGGHYGFVQDWRPEDEPLDVESYYAASFAIFMELDRSYGGMDLYRRFFKGLEGIEDITDVQIVERLGSAAGTEVRPLFERWGFDVLNSVQLGQNLEYIRERIRNSNPLLQPYLWVASLLAERAEGLLESGNIPLASILALLASILTKWAMPLTAATYASLLLVLTHFVFLRRSDQELRQDE